MHPRTLILCPMRVEADALGDVPGAHVVVSGPGPLATARRLERLEEQPERILLAGIAGGLTPDAPVGSARAISGVRGPKGERWIPSPEFLEREHETWVVAGSDVIVGGAQAKRDLAARTGARLVDMESHVFAEVATRRGWRWGIVRGVSDGVEDVLPDDLMDLIDEEGRPRTGRALRRMALRPALVPILLRLSHRTSIAMRSVREVLLRLLAENAGR